MEKRIITISREFGSGGRTIGKLVAEHLGIRCYDAELIQILAAESGFDENYIKEVSAGGGNESAYLFIRKMRNVSPEGLGSAYDGDKIFFKTWI